MTPDQDPVGAISTKILPLLAGAVLTVSLFIWRIFFTRFFKKQDDFEVRLQLLEAERVTRAELKALESKIEQASNDQSKRLDDIYKLLISMKAVK